MHHKATPTVDPKDFIEDSRPIIIPSPLFEAGKVLKQCFKEKMCGPARAARTCNITTCDEIIPCTSREGPHQLFPYQNCCDRDACPRAPIVFTSTDESEPFVTQGNTFRLLAGAIDTRGNAEIAHLIVAPGITTQPLVHEASDLAIAAITSGLTVTVNGTPWVLQQGGFAYIYHGSSYSWTNTGTVPASAFVTFIRPGGLVYYNTAAQLEEAVGDADSVDPCILQGLGDKYCVSRADRSVDCTLGGEWAFNPPGSIRFIPAYVNDKHESDCDSSWGLNCSQMLLLKAIDQPTAPTSRRSAIINPFDSRQSIVLPYAEPTEVTLEATVVRNPKYGTASTLDSPLINNNETAVFTTGATYYVRYEFNNKDGGRGNVVITPFDPTNL